MLEGFRVQNLHFQGSKLAVKSAFWDHWETAVLGNILARRLLEPDFGTLAACGPAIKSAFWDHWATAVLGQILAGSLLEADFETVGQFSAPSGIIGKQPFWAKSWPSLLGAALKG